MRANSWSLKQTKIFCCTEQTVARGFVECGYPIMWSFCKFRQFWRHTSHSKFHHKDSVALTISCFAKDGRLTGLGFEGGTCEVYLLGFRIDSLWCVCIRWGLGLFLWPGFFSLITVYEYVRKLADTQVDGTTRAGRAAGTCIGESKWWWCTAKIVGSCQIISWHLARKTGWPG